MRTLHHSVSLSLFDDVIDILDNKNWVLSFPFWHIHGKNNSTQFFNLNQQIPGLKYCFCSACSPKFQKSVWVSTVHKSVTSPLPCLFKSSIHYCHQIIWSLCHSSYFNYLSSLEEKLFLYQYKYLPTAVFFFFY